MRNLMAWAALALVGCTDQSDHVPLTAAPDEIWIQASDGLELQMMESKSNPVPAQDGASRPTVILDGVRHVNYEEPIQLRRLPAVKRD